MYFKRTLTISFRQIWAITKKDLQLDLRYIAPLISKNFISPIKTMAWFLIIYSGFFSHSVNNFGGYTKENYIINLLIGSIFSIFFNLGAGSFPAKFFNEKWWQTIQGTLIAPINSYKLVLGISLSELIKAILGLLMVSAVALFLHPIPFYNFFIIFGIIIYTFIGLAAMGLIKAAFILVNENLNSIVEYFFLAVSFLSCFYYPIESFPSILRPIAYYNPIYQSLFLIRNIWLDQPISLFNVLYPLFFMLLLIVVGTSFYNFITKRFDIDGY